MLQLSKEDKNLEMGPVQYPFWFGGSASSISACLTHPLDLVKVRVQTRPLGTTSGVSGIVTHIVKTEGVRGLYSGLSASVLRQLTYSTVRFSIYDEMKLRMRADCNFPILVAIASFSGFVGGFAGNFADVLNVRMQYDSALPPHQRRQYKHALDGLIRMTREEGFWSLFKGCLPHASRAAIQTAGQLASYDTVKSLLLEHTRMEDNLTTQLFSSFLAGVIAATVTNPIDVIKTRVMAAKKTSGIFETMMNMSQNDGFRWIFKGWLPSFLRLGPHTVCTFVILELHRDTYRKLQAFQGQKETGILMEKQ